MNKEKVYLKGYVVGHDADTLGYKGLQIQLENMDIVEVDKNLIYKIDDKPQRVTIPQFVAEYIEFKREYDFHVYGAMREIEKHYDKRVPEWFYEKNVETFVRAWLDGYEVEKEPKYTVKFKATKQYLCNDDLGPHFDPSFRTNFTKSDLEKLDLGWVFDCPGMEVEEV